MKKIDIKSFVEIYRDFLARALYIANRYHEMVISFSNSTSPFSMVTDIPIEDLGVNSRLRSTPRPFETVEMPPESEKVITCGYRFNSSCHCHPAEEIWNWEFPSEWINLSEEEVDMALFRRMEEMQKKFKEKKMKEKLEKEKENQRKREALEATERNLLKELKQKYE